MTDRELRDRDIRERDILVASNEFAYVQDLTKGDIVLYVGPTKISLSNTERLVELKNDRFVPVRTDDASLGVHPFVTASSSQYIVVENPAKDPTVRPLKGNNANVELLVGRKIVVPGPATFPLWPGQKANVVSGHELREDEYLIVRVYDAVEGDPRPIGTESVVRGSDTSFYIPRTGLEVVPWDGGYVRKARRLRKNMGLHLRVVRPFVAEEGDQLPPGAYRAGQDIFLKDREGFFFPTEQLEIIGEVEPIPVADKEGLYVRDLATGRITTVLGPRNYLADPTEVEVVVRDLSPRLATLYGLVGRDPDKAISIYIPPSYAVLVTANNRREVVEGPRTRILAYDEDLEVLKLSTGRPKTDENLLEACFLQTEGNKVSDVIRVKTTDHVELEVVVSYRVSFTAREGNRERWFHVNNYVGLLCDHLRSIVRATARAHGIEEFYGKATDILRSAILGGKRPDQPREGRVFEENGMWVYDVEVLDVRILDEPVKKLLFDAQRTAIVFEVNRRNEENRLLWEKLKESVNRQIYEAQGSTLEKAVELEASKQALALRQLESSLELDERAKLRRAQIEARAVEIESDASAAAARKEAELERQALEARVQAFVSQMAALQPELVATLKTLGHQQLVAELSRNVSPLAILGGTSVSDVVERILGSLPVGAVEGEGIKRVLARAAGKNGAAEPQAPRAPR